MSDICHILMAIFYSGHLANKYVPTDPTMTDPTVTPSLRTPHKVSLLGMAHRVPYVLFIIEILYYKFLIVFFLKKILILTHLFFKKQVLLSRLQHFLRRSQD